VTIAISVLDTWSASWLFLEMASIVLCKRGEEKEEHKVDLYPIAAFAHAFVPALHAVDIAAAGQQRRTCLLNTAVFKPIDSGRFVLKLVPAMSNSARSF
jgi:hypothetical protein